MNPEPLRGSCKLCNKYKSLFVKNAYSRLQYAVELQWLEHLWDYENMFETGVVRANEC